jgi:hypothetical protein
LLGEEREPGIFDLEYVLDREFLERLRSSGRGGGWGEWLIIILILGVVEFGDRHLKRSKITHFSYHIDT